MLKAIRLLSLASLLLLARADTNSLSLPLVIFDAGFNAACNNTGTTTLVQIGPIGSGPELLDVNPFNFGQLTVQITPDTAVIGAPFKYGDLIAVYGQWDGNVCVASILEKQ